MASKKITQLPAAAGANLTDLLAKVNDPSGTPQTQKLTITQLVTLLSPLILPSGTILIWKGTIATIPTGFVLCNGANGTPDLRNKFVVCADADSGGAAKTTLTGAATQSGGSISHTHTINDPGHNHTLSDGVSAALQPGDPILDSGSGGAWDPAVTVTGSTDSANTGITNNATAAPQPYFALAYIMKT